MRQLHTRRFIDLVLILLLVLGVWGYVASAEVPLAFALTRLSPSSNPNAAESPALQTSNQLVVIAFSDTTGAGPFECPGCDKIYSSADQEANADNPLPAMEFVVRNARTGEELGRQEAAQQPQGRYQAIFQISGDLEDDVVLDLSSDPEGFQLCPNSPASRTISPTDFVLGTHEEVYAFWLGCPVGEPTGTPIPPTATPVPPTETPIPPTATPVSPTATPLPTETSLPERSVVVEAFVDVTGQGGLQCPGCDRIFSSSDQEANATDPLPNMDFILRAAETGRLLARQTTTLDTQGRARTRFRIPAGFDQEVIVELASVPNSYQLCPNMEPARTIQPDDFILGTHLEQFSFWRGCEVPEPTLEPSPTSTATPRSPTTSTATPRRSPTPTMTTEFTPTTTPTSLPEGQLSAVVTSRGLHVRTGPGIEYQRLGAVGSDTQLILDGRDQAGNWVHGRAPEEELEGWLSADFMRIDGKVMSLPVLKLQATATPTLPAGSELTAVVTTHGLHVRAGPGVNYDRLGAVGDGTELILNGRNRQTTWVHGEAPEEGLKGWLSLGYMRIDGNVGTLPVLEPSGDLLMTPTKPAVSPTPTEVAAPGELPETGGLSAPLWGLLAMASALLLAISHVWRWVREEMSA